jgi:DNA polymerase-3 subunit delta'
MVILIARSFYSLPATIRSRCQILKFSPPNKKEIRSFLKDNFFLSKEKIDKILIRTASQVGLAINLAGNPEAMEKEKRVIDQIVKILSKKNFEAGIELSDFILSFQPNLEEVLNILLELLRDLILFKLGVLPIASADPNFKRLLDKYSQQELLFLIDEIIKVPKLILANVNPKLVIGNLFVNI